jgi:plasmid stabilization system protein ParE
MHVEWSPRAVSEFIDLIGYLLEEWGEDITKKFINRLQFVISNISERPELYPATGNRKNVRRCVISKQTSLYYRIRNEKIELITLFDSRKNPARKNL